MAGGLWLADSSDSDSEVEMPADSCEEKDKCTHSVGISWAPELKKSGFENKLTS